MQNILADIQYIPELVKTQWEVSELMNSTFVIWYVDISILNVVAYANIIKSKKSFVIIYDKDIRI